MRRFLRALPILALALAFTALVPATPANAMSPALTAQSSSTTVVSGELLKVDTTSQTFTVKQSNGQDIEFQYNSDTKVEGSDSGVQGLASETGTRVTVHYKEESGQRMATMIQINKKER